MEIWKELCERRGSTLKSKFDEADFLVVANKALNKTDQISDPFSNDLSISLLPFNPYDYMPNRPIYR